MGASIKTTLELWALSLREVKRRIGPLFSQERSAVNAGLFLDGLLGDERRKTGWMRAEAAGDPGPWRQQALLGRDRWDADALRDLVREYVVEHLADDDAVLVIDETGFLKQGTASCGVARQYTGSAGQDHQLRCSLSTSMGAPPRSPLMLRRDTTDSCCAAQEAELLRRRLANSDARVGYRISVCSSGAASICQRASTNVGHTIVLEDSPTGALPPAVRNGMSDCECSPPGRLMDADPAVVDQAAGCGSTSRPIAHRKADISRAIATVTTVWRLPLAISLR